MALGGRLFGRQKDVEAGEKLVDSCIWTYEALSHGIIPEVFFMAPRQQSNKDCRWDEKVWKDQVLRKAGKDVDVEAIIEAERLPKGFTAIPDRRYILRPEAAESVFILYPLAARTPSSRRGTCLPPLTG